MNDIRFSERRALNVNEFCAVYGIGRTKFYSEVKNKRINVARIGGKTLIPRDEAERWLRDAVAVGGVH